MPRCPRTSAIRDRTYVRRQATQTGPTREIRLVAAPGQVEIASQQFGASVPRRIDLRRSDGLRRKRSVMKVLEEASRGASVGALFPMEALNGLAKGAGGVLLVFWKAQ